MAIHLQVLARSVGDVRLSMGIAGAGVTNRDQRCPKGRERGMSLHVEWISTRYLRTFVAEAGAEIGEDTVSPGNIALVLDYDEAVVIEGPPKDLIRALTRALQRVERAVGGSG